MTRENEFIGTHMASLSAYRHNNPQSYRACYHEQTISDVAKDMAERIKAGRGFTMADPGLRETCAMLKVAKNVKAIIAYLNGEVAP